MEKIKEAIEEFKKENGNHKFTEKDLLMYLVTRVDNLPCNDHLKAMYEIKTDVKTNIERFKTWRWIAGILFTIVLTLLAWSRLS